MTIKKIISIGRSELNDYHLKGDSVSNEHALLIESDNNKYLLVDCMSTNGTRILSVSGAPEIKQIEVFVETTLFFGDVERTVRDIVSRTNSQKNNRNNITQFRDPIDGSIRQRVR